MKLAMGVLRTRHWLTAGMLGATMLATTAATAAADDAPAPDPGACPAQQVTQPFAPWGDSGAYTPAPDGDFESGLSGWSLSGDAGLVAGAEPWSVSDANESQSLDLPAGSSATSPSVCIAADDPSIRFFAVNRGDSASVLAVTVSATTLDGIAVSLPVATITSDGTWEPSPILLIGVNLLALDTTLPAQFTFTPVGAGDWQIDDLYVDPWGRT